MKKYVDRGSLLRGQDRTSRDNRVPFVFPRSIENFSLPDKRSRRRVGYGSVHEHVRTQALAKHTGVTISKRKDESIHNKGTFLTTPLSYGLIRWQNDYQLRTSEPKTIEFMLRLGEEEELVKNPFTRYAHYDTGGTPTPATGWANYDLRGAGVYVLDQTILSNNHIFDNQNIDQTGNVPATNPGVTDFDLSAYMVSTSNNFDVFPLTTVAFGYTVATIFCEFNMVDTSTAQYRKTDTLFYTLPSYVPGTIYHVALVHDDVGGTLKLYIDGTERDSFTLPGGTWKFVGEWDEINGITYASGQKRDIVILNECTVRGSYSSTCKTNSFNHGNQTFHHGFGFAGGTAGLVPWALSPPRGTAMWDLRIWNEARSTANIGLWKNKRILASDTNANLKGNWLLNDGGVICLNNVTGLERRYCTVHHGYPGYVNESDMLNGIGLKLGDGQHIIRSFRDTDRDLGVGVADKLGAVFAHEAGLATTLRHQEKHDFTVQMQVMIPDALQTELNDDSDFSPAVLSYDLGGIETRRPIYVTTKAIGELHDGTKDDAATNRVLVTYLAGTTPSGSHMAFDQTLFSIEGTQQKNSTIAAPNEADRRRIPVARGLITPAGKLVFELFKQGATTPRALRLVSASTLVVGKVYTITFVQRSRYVYTAVGKQLNASGWDQEIWIENVTDAIKPTVPDATYAHGAEGTDPFTTSIVHQHNYDIIIGASYVNDGWDWLVNAMMPGAIPATAYSSYIDSIVGANARADHGPWPVQQHFMTPYQDQPGNFVIGMFRMWSIAILSGEIKTLGDTVLGSQAHTPDLLFNLEFDAITGTEIKNNAAYPDSFMLGYKGWGEPQGYADLRFNHALSGNSVFIPKKWYDSPWANEDCLGYIRIDSEDYNARKQYTEVNGILPFKSSYAQQYGVAAIYADSAAFDETVSGTYEPLYCTGHGLLSEFLPNQKKYGTVVGNRLIITSPNGIPKVFDGSKCTVAGFSRWTGGVPLAYAYNGAGNLAVSSWYGIAVVYWAEGHGIYHVSPVVAVHCGTADDTIDLYSVPQHPDPRVTIVEVYRTIGQVSESLALAAPLYKTRLRFPVFANANSPAEIITLTESDANITGVILDRNVTEMPICAYSAALNERLYLAGDPLNPDTVYFTDAGNPERIDKLANSLEIPESSGDAVTGMLSAFGAIYIFKPNAIWRLDDLGGNQHQFTWIAGVGSITAQALETFVDPDSGRTAIFFWSQHGPYLFDGSNVRYIGTPIEESSVDGSSAAQYSWIDASSVVVGHNAVAREIMCTYSPRVTINDVTTDMGRAGKAVVFNYKSNAWYQFLGLPGSYALSFSYSSNEISARPTQYESINYILFLGSKNGKLFSWGTSKYDGLPTGFTAVVNAAVTDNDAGTLGPGEFAITGLTPTTTEDLLDTWITFVYTPTGDWVTAPVIDEDVTNGTVTVDIIWFTGASFNPDAVVAADMKAYICQPPAHVEFPWDELDLPFYDKQIVQLITWHNKIFSYKLQHNYDSSVVVQPWTSLTDATSQRKKTNLSRIGRCESVKLSLVSFDLDAALDAVAYEVAPSGRGNVEQ